jgi:hypothetical protein
MSSTGFVDAFYRFARMLVSLSIYGEMTQTDKDITILVNKTATATATATAASAYDNMTTTNAIKFHF